MATNSIVGAITASVTSCRASPGHPVRTLLRGLGVLMCLALATLSLAILEIMVHLEDYAVLCSKYSFIPIEIPSDAISVVDPTTLPSGWDSAAPGSTSQQIGDSWASALRSPILSVPMVLVPDERNYLLNPIHPDFGRIIIGKAQKLPFNRRFIK